MSGARPRVLVCEPLAEGGVETLAASCEVEHADGADRAATLARVDGFDALVVRSATVVDRELLERATRLRVIGRAGVGVDNVDVAEATRRGIIVCNAPESNSVSTAEHTIALLLALVRHVPQAHAATIAGRWERSRFAGTELAGKALGIVGFGRIGQLVATRAAGLEMRVSAYDPYVTPERFRELGVQEAGSLDELLASSDVVTLHAPAGPETRHLIDARALALMRPGARLVNAARGSLVDVEALCGALDEGRLAGAALDVFEHEPLTDSPLFGRDDVVLTPHLAASTREAQDRAGRIVAEQVVAALSGGAVRYAVNVPRIADEDAAVLAPFVPLADKLGRLAMALAGGRVDTVEVATAGQLVGRDTRYLTLAALRGVFEGRVEDVNEVNAPLIAEQHGIEVREQRRAGTSDYTNLLAVTARSGDAAVTVVGTTLGVESRPWLVRALGYEVEIELDARVLVLENRDVPGMIGRIGTLLGDAGVNIANMNVSRGGRDGNALMVISVDSEPDADVLATLRVTDGVAAPRFVRLA